ncbi:MAG: serine hydrolase domain-containing protein [Bacteroidota bacterium]
MKKHFHLLLFVLLSLFWTFNTKGQDLNLEGLEDKIESLVPAMVKDSSPGLVIGIVHNGELILSKAYGMANLSYNIPNDPKIIYNLGSVSKQFLGYAFALLHVEGQLNVDDPVGKYLDDWPEFSHKVTIRHLLSHTSGYREAYTLSNLAGRVIGVDRLAKRECLNVVRKQTHLEFIPGSRFTYNSTAWVILAEILEKVTGQAAHEWVKENMLIPLGMKNTHIESFVGEVLPNAAESYYYDQKSGYGNLKSNRAIFGAAEVYSSIEDLVHWLNNFQNPKVGDQAVMDLFVAPYPLNDGSSSEYGFGIRNSLHKGLKVYNHTGAHESFLTQQRYYPEYNFGIVTISNFGGNGWIATNKIAEYVLKEHMTFPKKVEHQSFDVPLDQLKQLEGTYLSPYRNETTDVKLVNDTLTVLGGVQIIPISKNRFYSKAWGIEFEITKSANQATQLIIYADSKSEYQKVDHWMPLSEELKEYESSYKSRELETTYHLLVKEDRLTIQHRWLGEIGLTPITKDLFRSDWGWLLEFERTRTSEIIGFDINSSRTLNVFFEKE